MIFNLLGKRYQCLLINSSLFFFREDTCQSVAQEMNYRIVPPFDDSVIMAGQVIKSDCDSEDHLHHFSEQNGIFVSTSLALCKDLCGACGIERIYTVPFKSIGALVTVKLAGNFGDVTLMCLRVRWPWNYWIRFLTSTLFWWLLEEAGWPLG